jgi:hemolysin D
MKLFQRGQEKLEAKLAATSEEEPALKQSRRWVNAVTWTLIGTTGFSIAWLALAQTEEIAVVSGKLEPIGMVQEIRMPIGGVTEEVLVKEGQQVKAGQVLIRLDTEASGERLANLKTSIALKQGQSIEKKQELQRYLELNSTEQRTLQANIGLQSDIVNRLDGLQKQGATAELQLLQERNRLQETSGKLEQTQVDRLRQTSLYRQQLQQLSAELSELRSRLSEQVVTLRYQEIRSPVDGMVFDLKSGAGFVAQTSEPVLKVVPLDKLQAAVEIPSRQIGFVRVGQKAEVSIDSYPSNDFGVIKGEVERVSSDALAPDPAKAQTEYRYPGLVRLNRQQLRLRDGRLLPLQAGMSLQAHIKLRQVSYLQLLLGGFRDRADSLRQL